MSKREFLTRYLLIIKRLKKSPATFDEIQDYLERESSWLGLELNVSKRTMQRDIADILSIFGISIQYDFSRKVYEITNDGQSDWSTRMLEAYEVFDALRMSDKISSNVYFDSRKAAGAEHLHEILEAIKSNWSIKFDYQKFWEDEKTIRQGAPYALKEFKNRWYVLMRDNKDKEVKTFALDRITDLETIYSGFTPKESYDAGARFQHCFGITCPHDSEPEEIILSFDPVQGKYLKSQPLHSSQTVLLDTEDELRLSITVYVTHELVMELLSFGDNVKVLKPDSLVKTIQDALRRALDNYK